MTTAPSRWRFVLSTALLLAVLGSCGVSTVRVAQRAAGLEALVADFQQGRDQYIVGVCHDLPQLAQVPAWARPLQERCVDLVPDWGSDAAAKEAQAAAILPHAQRGGFAAVLGHILRSFNPVVLLEIFVALTVAFFVLLGVRGGETPAETVISRLGSGLRERFVKTARRAAVVGVVLGAGSLVAGTWSSELQEEKRVCHDTAVSYGYLVGIDQRCATVRAEVAHANELRDEAIAARSRCEISVAETEARMDANASIERTAADLGQNIRDEQDRKTRVLLDAVKASFETLAGQLAEVRAETSGLRAEAAKEKSLAALATKASVEVLAKEGADRAAAIERLAKAVAREESVARIAAALEAHDGRTSKTLDELRARQCLAKGELAPVETMLREMKAAATAVSVKGP